MASTPALQKTASVVLVRHGRPLKSMGWYHAAAQLRGRIPSAALRHVVEPLVYEQQCPTESRLLTTFSDSVLRHAPIETEFAQAVYNKIGSEVLEALELNGSASIGILLQNDSTAIKSTQDAVIDGLPDGNFIITSRLQMAPGLFLQVDSIESIDALENSPQVVQVDLDEESGEGSSFRLHQVSERQLLADAVPLIEADDRHVAGNLGTGVVVAVLDSGFDSDHPDLANSLVDEACFLGTLSPDPLGGCPNGMSRQTGPGSAEDDQRHGTHVTSIITSNGVQAPRGVAPNADIVAIKVLDNLNRFYRASEIVAALDYILQNPQLGVRVINMSLSTFARFAGECDSATSWTQLGSAVINNLRNNGVTIFASAGNNNDAVAMGFPACLANVVAVGASDDNDIAASFTNANSQTDVFAPGVGIVASQLGGGTISLSGTSMASPMAAGCAALLLESGDAVTPVEVEERLRMSTTTVSKYGFSYPRIDCGPDDGAVDCEVEYVLWNADTGEVVGLLEDELESDGSYCIPDYAVNIQARPSSTCSRTDSAYMRLKGPVRDSRTENVSPYRIFRTEGRSLLPGEYTIDSDLYSKGDLRGDLVVSKEVTLKAQYCANPCTIEFILFDAESDSPVGPLKNVECIMDNTFSIQAHPSDTCSTTESAAMKLTGPIRVDRVENRSPYMIFGDPRKDISGRPYKEGSYKIEARIFSERNRRGDLVVEREFEFEVENCNRRLRSHS